MTQSIETLARGIAADTWEQSARAWRLSIRLPVEDDWIKSTRAMFMNGTYDDGREYFAALAGIKLGREQAAEVADQWRGTLVPTPSLQSEASQHNIIRDSAAQKIAHAIRTLP